MDFLTILAECLDSHYSAAVEVTKPVLHRLYVIFISLILPGRSLTMLLDIFHILCVDINFNFKKRVCGNLFVSIFSSLQASVDP